MAQYQTLTSNIPELQRRVRAVQKKLQKYNLDCEFSLGKEYLMPVPHYTEFETPFGTEMSRVDDVICSVTEYEFQMPAFQISGWTLIASIDHNKTTDGKFCNVVSIMPGIDIKAPTAWFSQKPACEHCNSSRYRKTTLMFQNESGEFKQVGSSCMHDFIGITSESVLKSLQDVQSFVDQELRFNGNYVSEEHYRFTVDFLADAIAKIKEAGYQPEGTTTHAAWCGCEHTDEDVALANKIIDFFTTSEDPILDDTFYLNIKSALSVKYTKKTGFVAYAYVAYQKIMDAIDKRDTSPKPTSEWVGEVNTRCKLQLELVSSYTTETYFGESYIYKFNDADGNMFVWYTSKFMKPYEGFAEVTGTIKEHSTYRDEKQTVLTRCKLVVKG